MAIAQTKTDLEILGTPDNSFGYLIWTTNDSTYRYASLNILKADLSLPPDAPFGINNPRIVKKMEVYGKNYSKIPFQIWRDAPSNIQYSIAINTYGGGGIATDTIPMVCLGCGSELICSWPCNGPNYAYRIDERYIDWFQTYTYSVQRYYAGTNNYGIAVPFYRYFGQDEFAYYTGLVLTTDGVQYPGYGDPNFHEIAQNWNQLQFTPQWTESQLRVVRYANTSTFRDINGAIISGSYVYGIQKARGDWRTQMNSGTYSTTVEGSTADRCNVSNNLSTIRQFINTEAHPYTPLVCEPNLGGVSGGYGAQEDCGWSDIYEVSVEFDHIDIDIETDPVTGDTLSITNNLYYDSLWDFAGMSYGCPEGDGTITPTTGTQFMAYLQLLSLSSYNNGQKNILTTTGPDLFNEDGSPNVPSITLDRGLYRIAVKYPDRPLNYTFFEIVEPGIETLPYKDFFSANIYPNPIGSQSEYSIDITTSARLKMVYEIYDHLGNVLDKSYFDLEKNHNKTHIFPSSKLDPRGLTFHKFSFEDGSYETITTVR